MNTNSFFFFNREAKRFFDDCGYKETGYIVNVNEEIEIRYIISMNIILT